MAMSDHTQWMPIKTAPKDGTHVLVARTDTKPIRAWHENGRWWMHGCGRWSRAIADLTGANAPTEWMPLPAGPGQSPAVPASPISTGAEELAGELLAALRKSSGLVSGSDRTWFWIKVCFDGLDPAHIALSLISQVVEASPPAPAEHGAEIRELSEKATPGPWAYRPDRYDDWGFIRAPRDTADMPGQIVAVSRGECLDTHDAHRAAGTDPYEPNGRFIVALVNAYRSGELLHRSETGGQGAGRDGETLETIAAWCEETFGPIEPARIVSRAGEEMDELRETPERVEEAADVVICLARYPGLWAAIERKMAVNRKRRWRCLGDGTGYHIKPEAPSHPAPSPADTKTGEV